MKEKLKEYLTKLRVDLVMKDKLDGWHINWLHKKIKETEEKLKSL